jgi:hypothetical protein
MKDPKDAYQLACAVLDNVKACPEEVRPILEKAAKLLLLTTEAMNAHGNETAGMLRGLRSGADASRMDVLLRTAFAHSLSDWRGRDNE